MRRLFRGGVYLRAASISGNTLWGRTYLGSTACSKGIKLNVWHYPGGSAREMRAAVTVFRGIARNCVIALDLLMVQVT